MGSSEPILKLTVAAHCGGTYWNIEFFLSSLDLGTTCGLFEDDSSRWLQVQALVHVPGIMTHHIIGFLLRSF